MSLIVGSSLATWMAQGAAARRYVDSYDPLALLFLHFFPLQSQHGPDSRCLRREKWFLNHVIGQYWKPRQQFYIATYQMLVTKYHIQPPHAPFRGKAGGLAERAGGLSRLQKVASGC